MAIVKRRLFERSRSILSICVSTVRYTHHVGKIAKLPCPCEQNIV